MSTTTPLRLVGSVVVIDRKKVDDVWRFRTKGDNNDPDDGCWIEADEVEGYITELHKNTEPHWAPIRDLVNGAKADLDEVKEIWQDIREANGCHRTKGQCTWYTSTGRQRYQNAIQHWNEVFRYQVAWSCAHGYAYDVGNYETSQTDRGEILVKQPPTCPLGPPEPPPPGQEWNWGVSGT